MTTNVKDNEFKFIQGLTEELSGPALIFPTSLKATMKIRHAILQENISNDNLALIIGAEPVLSAQVLKLSNSATYNPGGKPTTELRTATMRLGFSNVRNLTISVGMKQLTEHKEVDGEISQLMEGLWDRSMRVASLSSVIAKTMTKVNPDNAMLAGLLHDVGKFYILNRAKHYQSLFTSVQALWNVVDAWHANIGAAILECWEIPDDIRHAVQNLGNPDYVHRGAINLTDVLVAANLLDAHFEGRSARKLNWDELPTVLHPFALDVEKSEELRALAKVELEALLSSIG